MTRSVVVAGEAIALTYLEFQLLTHLAQHPGRVFNRGELLARLWGRGYKRGPRTVDVHIRRLRIALGEKHAEHIETVRRVGYTFVADPWRSLRPRRTLTAASISSSPTTGRAVGTNPSRTLDTDNLLRDSRQTFRNQAAKACDAISAADSPADEHQQSER
jgi:DNA-binding winged helix-turn-helix (wHTH) protein